MLFVVTEFTEMYQSLGDNNTEYNNRNTNSTFFLFKFILIFEYLKNFSIYTCIYIYIYRIKHKNIILISSSHLI